MLGLVAFLLFAPWGFFAPLTVLLLFGRPRSGREWRWIAAGIIWTALLWLRRDGTLLYYAVNAWSALLAGVFGIIALARPRGRTPAAWFATAVSAALFVLLLRSYGLSVGAVESEVARMFREVQSLFGPGTAADRTFASAGAALSPAIFAVFGAIGLNLAWRWYHRIATAPIGEPPSPFEAFRFSDHLVWLLVAALALTLAQAAGYVATGDGPANLLLAIGALYLVRGLAVVWPGLWRVPPLGVTIVIASVILLPFAVSGLFGIGLADTWVDFRRRRAAAQGGGPWK